MYIVYIVYTVCILYPKRRRAASPPPRLSSRWLCDWQLKLYEHLPLSSRKISACDCLCLSLRKSLFWMMYFENSRRGPVLRPASVRARGRPGAGESSGGGSREHRLFFVFLNQAESLLRCSIKLKKDFGLWLFMFISSEKPLLNDVFWKFSPGTSFEAGRCPRARAPGRRRAKILIFRGPES